MSVLPTRYHTLVRLSIAGWLSMSRFGEKLRLLRTKQGMTLKELAAALGYTSHSYLSEVETGRLQPSVEFALRVSRWFGVSLDQLLKDELEIDEGTDA
jgi:XRE family transcriptional regulator of biofilm formation